VAAAAIALTSCSSGSSAVSSATSAAGSVASNVATAAASAKDAAGSALSSAKDAAGSAVSSAKDAAGSALSSASSKAAGAASSAAGAVSSKLSEVTGAATPAGPATVGTTSGALGVYLVDGDGKTLYMYDPDEAAPGTSTCYDACATAWPPLLTNGAATTTGTATAAELSTITRTDGSTQVVYGAYPLYYYAKDTAAGQTTGQAVGGVWWVIGADGVPIKTAG
jgi:predicted lipoprotein with Yx(FWY)xxD motif